MYITTPKNEEEEEGEEEEETQQTFIFVSVLYRRKKEKLKFPKCLHNNYKIYCFNKTKLLQMYCTVTVLYVVESM